MKDTGFVKLYRKLGDNPISSNLELMGLFSYILLNANYKEGSFYLGLEKITLQPGQILTSQRKLSTRFKVSLSKINRMIKILEKEGILKHHKNTRYTIIEVCNWSRYQGSETREEHKENTDETREETYKEEIRIIKNNKEIYSGENGKFSSPMNFSDLYKKNITKDFLEKCKEKYFLQESEIKKSSLDFWNYWTEKSPKGKKERWQKEKTFDIILRFHKWLQNEKKWNKTTYSQEKKKLSYEKEEDFVF